MGSTTISIEHRERPARARDRIAAGRTGMHELAKAPPGQSNPHTVHRGLIWALVLMAHVGLGWFIVKNPDASVRSAAGVESLELVMLAQKPLAPITVASPVIAPSSIPIIARPNPLELSNERNEDDEDEATGLPPVRGAVTPPRRLDTAIDTASFARAAGLTAGATANVVLRVEVRGSGAVGRVEVDVSSGNARADEAAIAYVRTLKWVGGKIDKFPKTMWVRWGVHLQRSASANAIRNKNLRIA